MDTHLNSSISGSEKEHVAPKPRRRRRSRLVVGLAVVALAFAIAWLVHAPMLRQVGGWWSVSDELAHADAIVVLGGSLEVRPFAAAALYKRGFADKVLVSNVQIGRAERLGFIPSHTELNRDVLLKSGVPESAIVTFGENNSSTFEEAEAVRAWAAQSQAKSIIVPTELFAARRTRWIFNRELKPAGVAVIIRAFPPPDYGTGDWWRNRHGLVDFNNEVLKYLYYRLAY
jgi:uncharacterized SAM-binding protein YcdF (DUF218 family)